MRLRRTRLFAPMLAALLVAVGLIGGSLTQSASASHGARITIHNATCASDVSDLFGECHENRFGGVWFCLPGTAGHCRETDANGVVSWTPGAGTHVIFLDDAWWLDAGEKHAYVYCSNQVTGEVLWDGPLYDQPVITITTTAGQDVICDWYNLDVPVV